MATRSTSGSCDLSRDGKGGPTSTGGATGKRSSPHRQPSLVPCMASLEITPGGCYESRESVPTSRLDGDTSGVAYSERCLVDGVSDISAQHRGKSKSRECVPAGSAQRRETLFGGSGANDAIDGKAAYWSGVSNIPPQHRGKGESRESVAASGLDGDASGAANSECCLIDGVSDISAQHRAKGESRESVAASSLDGDTSSVADSECCIVDRVL